MEKMEILQNMFDQADKYNLKMECIISLLDHLLGDLTPQELANACEHAMCEWDI